MSLDYWSFRGVQFLRAVSGSESQWFERTLATSIDVIATTATRVIDIGGFNSAPLALAAHCLTAGDATALVSYLGSQGTLISATGLSGNALLIRADRVINNGVYWRVNLEFEAVS